jgi:hypothetical protein
MDFSESDGRKIAALILLASTLASAVSIRVKAAHRDPKHYR